MDSPKKNPHVTDHLANERTFLAWIRTAIAVMTLGVAINRFALFLMEMHQVVPEVRNLANRHVEKLGIGLVMLGIGALLRFGLGGFLMAVGAGAICLVVAFIGLVMWVASGQRGARGGAACRWRSAAIPSCTRSRRSRCPARAVPIHCAGGS